MSERGIQLHETADRQISELIDLLSARGEGALSLRCPGREKLGDGTVAAIAMHTADNYNRIAGFLQGNSHTRQEDARSERGRHRIPAFMRARGHGHDMHDSQSSHDRAYAAENVNLEGLLERLSAGQGALGLLAALTDQQLDVVPAASDMKFCDGQRTLEQILASLLNHQSHQIDALRAALA